MIKIISRSPLQLFKRVRLARFSTTAGNSKNVQSPSMDKKNVTIENIRNGIKHLRIYDEIDLAPADLDWEYLLDKKNLEAIKENSRARKGVGNIHKVHKLYEKLEKYSQNPKETDLEYPIEYDSTKIQDFMDLVEEIYKKASEIPNRTHESVPTGDADGECVLKTGNKIEKKMPTIDKISEMYGWLKEEHVSLYSTQRAYILRKELADLEQALVQYTLKYLKDKGFVFVSVPDILHHSIIESCGFQTKGFRNQVYKIDHFNEYGKYCLSGTSEMSLAGLLKNKEFNESELPLKLCSSSRCFRAEVSGSEREGKLYRLHEFTKIEMFAVTRGVNEASEQMLEEIRSIQLDLFSGLGLHLKVLNMSSHELGSPAFKKYDIESWMPGNQFYGEISSASNCTDYQSRRLHIKYKQDKSRKDLPSFFVHTLNGTACAIPRMLTAIVESNWDMDENAVHIPEKLQPYMNNQKLLRVPKEFRKCESLNNSRYRKK